MSKNNEQPCNECNHVLATLHCIDCQAFLCEDCFGVIHRHKILKNHVVDIIHKPNECFLCDHNRWCEKIQDKDFPTDFTRYVENTSNLKTSTSKNFKKCYQQLNQIFDNLERDLMAVKHSKLKLLESWTTEMNVQSTNPKIAAVLEHKIQKMCSCEDIFNRFLKELEQDSKNEENFQISVEIDKEYTPFADFVDRMVTLCKEGQPVVSECCNRCCMKCENQTDILKSIVRSEGPTGTFFHSLHRYSDLCVGKSYKVIQHVGIEFVILKALKDSAEVRMPSYEGFSNLRCHPDISLVLIQMVEDSKVDNLSLRSTELLAYDVDEGYIWKIQRDHLVKSQGLRIIGAIPVVLFEPFIDTQISVDCNEAFTNDKIFTIESFITSEQGRCIVKMRFVEPENIRHLSFIEFLADRDIKCLQITESRPTYQEISSIDDKVMVTSISSVYSAFIQSDGNSFSLMERKVVDCSTEDKDRIKNPRVGVWCLSKFEDVLCRAIVVAYFKGRMLLYYPDYGNFEDITMKTPLWHIPLSLSNLPCRLQRIHLDPNVLNTSVEELRKKFENQCINLKTFEPIKGCEEARLSWIDLREQRIYLQNCDGTKLDFITDCLEAFCSPNISPNTRTSDSKTGVFFMHCQRQKRLCRAVIEKFEDNEVSVRLVDYGIPINGILFSALRKCTPEISRIPVQAIRCKLENSNKLSNYFSKTNKVCKVYKHGQFGLFDNSPTPMELKNSHLDQDPVVSIDWGCDDM